MFIDFVKKDQKNCNSYGLTEMNVKERMTAAVLTASDTRNEQTDESGKVLKELLSAEGFIVSEYLIVTDDLDRITAALQSFVEREIDLVITTGGTGISPRDCMPEATLSVSARQVPGIAETIRAESLKSTKYAMLSRAVAVVAGKTLIINFPGSTQGVRECFEVIRKILPHSIRQIKGNQDH